MSYSSKSVKFLQCFGRYEKTVYIDFWVTFKTYLHCMRNIPSVIIRLCSVNNSEYQCAIYWVGSINLQKSFKLYSNYDKIPVPHFKKIIIQNNFFFHFKTDNYKIKLCSFCKFILTPKMWTLFQNWQVVNSTIKVAIFDC